jgi:hypothetical protein
LDCNLCWRHVSVEASKKYEPQKWHQWRQQGSAYFLELNGSWAKLDGDLVRPLESGSSLAGISSIGTPTRLAAWAEWWGLSVSVCIPMDALSGAPTRSVVPEVCRLREAFPEGPSRPPVATGQVLRPTAPRPVVVVPSRHDPAAPQLPVQALQRADTKSADTHSS